jgi:enoyl-CoA hydratase/carnithine racemase
VRGIVVTSAKPAFAAGWNLKELVAQMESASRAA